MPGLHALVSVERCDVAPLQGHALQVSRSSPEDWQQQLESSTQDVSRVIDERDGSFLCVFKDGSRSLEWQELNSEDYRVKKFIDARKTSDDTVNIISAEQCAKGLLLE